MKLTLNVWRQPASQAPGKLETYTLSDVSGDMSFLEMFDMLNEQLTEQGKEPVAQLWRARSKGPVKVLALDFDNTLWAGVFGDDGIAKLQCGDDFPGSVYKAFQNECLRLKSQGMLLVALSKNNADALDVFDTHPGVVLKRDDFVATAVNPHGYWVSGESAPICTKSTATPSTSA